MSHYKDNYAGPLGEKILPLAMEEADIASINKSCMGNVLSIDGEFLSEFQVINPIFLTIAKFIIDDHVHLLIDSDPILEVKIVYQILKLRTLFYHQRLLISFSPKIREEIISLCNSLIKAIASLPSLSQVEVTLVLFEVASALLYYKSESASRETLDMLSKCSRISLSWTGIAGRRLIHQREKVSLLSVVVSKNDQQDATLPSPYNGECKNLPEVIPLTATGDQDKYLEMDDVDESPVAAKDLSCFDVFIRNAFLLAHFGMLLISSPDSSMRGEQLSAIVNFIITKSLKDQASISMINWSLFSTALALRSIYVENKGLKAVRSCLQLEALISQISKPLQDDEKISQRLCLCWCIPGSLSAVDLKKAYARMLFQLGAPLSAYDVYHQLGDMTSAIKALVSASEYEKAISLSTTLLQKDLALADKLPLLCLLGDLRGGDITLYEEAWELSGHRYAAAKRSLGFSHQKKGNFCLSIDAFSTSLKINPLFASVWFSLGCCYVKVEKYDEALVAFRRSLATSGHSDIDDETGMSPSDVWSNISLTHTLQGNIPDAFYAIQEAVKGRYDDHRLWEKYLHLALRMGKDPLQVLLAISRLTEIRAESVDWNTFDMVWNTLRPISSDKSSQACLKFMTWIEEMESKFGNDVNYWKRRALMTSKLPHLDPESTYPIKIFQWDCWLRAYQILSPSTVYSVLSQVENMVALLGDMSRCSMLNQTQFLSILRTVSSRIKKAHSVDDVYIGPILNNIENMALSLGIPL